MMKQEEWTISRTCPTCKGSGLSIPADPAGPYRVDMPKGYCPNEHCQGGSEQRQLDTVSLKEFVAAL